MNTPQRYLCSSCGARFSHTAPPAPRCPSCLRATGLIPEGGDEGTGAASRAVPRPSSPWPRLAAVALVLAALGAVAWFVMSRTKAPSAPANAAAHAAAGPTATAAGQGTLTAALDGLPDALKARPDAVNAGVRALAKTLPPDATGLLNVVIQARHDGRLPPRSPEDSLPGEAPLSASVLATAWQQGGPTPPVNGFEVAPLAGALLQGRELGPVTYGYDREAPHARTSVTQRRYVVRAAHVPWVALDGADLDQGHVTPLTPETYHANALAWRALAAMDAPGSSGAGDRASRAVGAARRLAPDDPAVSFLAGVVDLYNGLTDMGMTAMESVAREHGDAMSWLMLGEYAMAADQAFKAQQYLERAAKLDPAFAQPHVRLGQLTLERMTVTPKDQHAALLKELKRHIHDADARDSNVFGLHALKAQLAVLDGHPEQAEALLREEISTHPHTARARLLLAHYFLDQSKPDEALKTLDQAVSDRLATPDVQSLRGEVLASQDHGAKAARAFEAALAQRPDDPTLRLKLAQLYDKAGDVDRARALLTDQLKHFPDDKDGAKQAGLLLSQLELNAGDIPAAQAALDGVLAVAPSDATALVFRYVVALLAGSEGVAPARDAAIRAVSSRSQLAQILLEQAEFHDSFVTEGERLLRDAVREDPQDTDAAPMLVALLVAKHDEQGARAFIAERVAKLPEADRANAQKQLQGAFDQAVQLRDAPPDQVPGEPTPDPATDPAADPFAPPVGAQAPEAGAEAPKASDAAPKAGDAPRDKAP